MKKLFISFCYSVLFLTVYAQHEHDSAIANIQKEEDFYNLMTIPIPKHIELEVGGMVFLPGDKLAVCTRRGEVWIISNPYMRNGAPPLYRRFARGLHEALGLNYINDELYVVQRSEITRLRDLDGDGEADEYKTVYTWPLAGNYHEYAYGPIVDAEGNMYISLNLGWTDRGESLSKWDGWMLKLDSGGNMQPFAAGLRSPAGMGFNADGAIFYSENQGDWVGSGYIAHVEEGDFMGNPESLKWAVEPGSKVKLLPGDIPDTDEPKYEIAKRVPGLKSPAVWLPHSIMGISTSDILLYDDKGKMGPFQGQLFIGDQGHSKIMRVALEKVRGVYQGVVFPFREGFNSGVLRMKWGSDGSMFAGMTNRGWGSRGNTSFGLQRIVWNGKIPFEMRMVKAMPDGFEIEFTRPVNRERARIASAYTLTRFTYQYGHRYGSPVINEGNCPVKAIQVSADGLRVRLVVDSLQQGYIHEIKTEGIRSQDNYLLLHNTGYYTLNEVPEGDRLTITAENRVSIKSPEHAHPRQPAPRTSTAKPPAGTAAPVATKRLLKQPAGWNRGPDQTIVLKPVPGLKFDQTRIIVRSGAKLKLRFDNTDDMPHNVVVTTPGAADEIGAAALNMGLSGEKLDYVPRSAKVLFYTSLLQPGKSETIYFTAPADPGEYPFVCTYPGHYLIMRGVLKVVAAN